MRRARVSLIDEPEIGELVEQWSGRRVLVVGDALLDGWLAGRSSRLCREAPIAVLDLEQARYVCGGAANTAVNVAALGGRATLLSAVGDDPTGGRLRDQLTGAGVGQRILALAGRRTAVKSRLLAGDQVVARVDEGDTGPLPLRQARALARLCGQALAEEWDAVVVCDYDAGTLTGPVRDVLAAARERLALLVVDAHDLRPWAALRPDLVTPSFAEALRLLGTAASVEGPARAGWVEAHARALAAAAGADSVAVTLDVDGTILIEGGAVTGRTSARAVPAVCAIGAGDSYVAAFALARAAGGDSRLAARAAQLAAQVAVSGGGTALCTAADLSAAAAELSGAAVRSGVVDAGTLAVLVADHRAQGRRIVFTNGCFDVLHRGHVGYLEEASRLGDVLIVAVNSDASVRRLKGADRPVNPVADRSAVLAGLASVDHVVVFDEDSPRELIALVRPDIYVKGGDYPPELIPEAPLVRQLGGEVRTMEYLPDFSTSQIIDRIRAR